MSTVLQGIYELIKKKLTRHSFSVSPITKINYGIQFEISKDMWESKLRIYEKKNGVLKIDYSPLKGEKAEAVRSIIEDREVIAEESITLAYPYIGTDESGKGDTFGPLTVAGVALGLEQERLLADAGVCDSKMNDDEANLLLAGVIRRECPSSFHVLTLMPEQYNLLYSQFGNLNPMLAGLHTEIIQTLIIRHNCPVAIVDQFADSRLITKHFENKKIKLYHTTGGEKYTAVAAASILAREAFLKGLKELSQAYGVDLPKGSGEHAARAMEKIKGKKLTGKMHMMAKTHFSNVKAVL